MPAFIHRIELNNGRVYQMGKEWPDEKDPNDPNDQKLLVGLIFYRPQLTESVLVQNEHGEEDDSVAVEETQLAYYEVWCMSENFSAQLDVAFSDTRNVQKVHDAVMQMGAIRKRMFYLHTIAEVDEIWAPNEALQTIMERTVEVFAAGQPQQQQSQPSNGAQPTATS